MAAAEPIRLVRDVAGRVPPNDLDAEAAVLSAILLKRGALDEVAWLTPGDFYSEANGRIFEAAIALASEGKPIDTVQVASWLRDRERLASVGGAAYIGQVADATPAVAHVEAHARTVATKARIRRVIAEAHVIYAEGYGDVGDANTWLEGVDARLSAAAGSAAADTLRTMQDVLTDVWADINARLNGTSTAIAGACTGLRDLDDAIGPLRPGAHSVVAGFWGGGKSALGLQCAIATASQKNPGAGPTLASAAHIISMEMPAGDLATRANFQQGRVDGRKAQAHRLRYISDVEWRSLTEASVQLSRLPVTFDDRANMSPEKIHASVRRAKARAAKEGRTLRLVLVDYVQLVKGTVRKNANREEEVAKVSWAMKEIAMVEKVHMMGIAQLNSDSRKGKEPQRPTGEHVRESKAIAMNADVMLLIHNPEMQKRSAAILSGDSVNTPSEAETCELILEKCRGGRTGTIQAVFWPALTLFADRDVW